MYCVGFERQDRCVFLPVWRAVVVVLWCGVRVCEVADSYTDEFREGDGLLPGWVEHTRLPVVDCWFVSFACDVDVGAEVISVVQ